MSPNTSCNWRHKNNNLIYKVPYGRDFRGLENTCLSFPHTCSVEGCYHTHSRDDQNKWIHKKRNSRGRQRNISRVTQNSRRLEISHTRLHTRMVVVSKWHTIRLTECRRQWKLHYVLHCSVLYHLNFIAPDAVSLYCYYFYRYFLSFALLWVTFNIVTYGQFIEPCGFSVICFCGSLLCYWRKINSWLCMAYCDRGVDLLAILAALSCTNCSLFIWLLLARALQ